MNFQDIILELNRYWAEQGCVLQQPYDMEVGAGTFHPATLLKALGPEPWKSAYPQPSRRPTDGRYGDNPNRLQHYYQYQVVIKPSPLDVQELYLESLKRFGLDLLEHDIRFVEDDWESPTLGAWGLGWEVWLDGMEITQFTYFQQAGSIDLHPVTDLLQHQPGNLLVDRVVLRQQDEGFVLLGGETGRRGLVDFLGRLVAAGGPGRFGQPTGLISGDARSALRRARCSAQGWAARCVKCS